MKQAPIVSGLVVLFALATAYAQPRRSPPPRPLPTAPALPATDAGTSTQWVRLRAPGTWQADCVASRGCATPRAIPRCASDLNVRSFAEVVDGRFGLRGRTVTVRGRLSSNAACTEMACPQGVCCNSCGGGSVSLTGTARTSVHTVALGTGEDPAFQCSGDDSGLCCGIDIPSGDVAVTGVFNPIPRSGGAWRIENPTLCVL
jgi:hypothetical protein